MFGKKESKGLVVAAENSTAGMLAIIEAMALNPEVDPDKLEKMLNMQERIFDKNAEIAFNVAMVKCQSEIPAVEKTGTNTQTNSDYAKLEVMQKTAMPFVSANGFALSYGTADPTIEPDIRITCKVSHINGHSRDYFVDFPRDDEGMKGAPTKTKTHGTGSSLTYGQRYLFKMMFNIQIGGLDKDGNRPPQVILEDQVANLEALIDEIGANKESFLQMLKVDKLEDLPSNKYDGAISRLEDRRKAG